MAITMVNSVSSNNVARLHDADRKWRQLMGINYRVFLIPVLLIIIGGMIWLLSLVITPTNYFLLLFGEVIFSIGLFVAIILGFWVMTIVRIPQR